MNNELVQSQLILLLCQQPELLAKEALRPEYLSKPYDEIYNCLVGLYISGQKVNLTSVLALPALSDEAKLSLERLKGYEEPEIGFTFAIERLEDAHLRHEFSSICRAGYESSHNEKADIKGSIGEINAKACGLLRSNSASIQKVGNFASLNDMMSWQAKNPGKLRGPETGFRRLDKIVNGWMPRYNLIGARPSVGKTALIGDIITSLCDISARCLLFSLEMPTDDIRARLLAKKSGVNISSHRDSPMNEFEMKNMFKAQRQIKQWNLWIDDSSDTSIDDIEAKTASLYAEHGDIHVFVDYLQLVELPGGRKMPKHERIAEISNRLKRLSRRFNISVTACAQLKRTEAHFDREAKRTVTPKPKLDDFRDSGDIEQDADLAMLLDRDIINPDAKDEATLIVAKQRNGATHPGLQLSYYSTTTTFKEKI